ncbi:putative xap5 domain containing protein [Botrytis fragariae]|uniref:Putative xap5 domain containing protein n=1 Tax=Botrytis fragariae TaxID=1964551 RepID=A0A8H6EHV3_9HELO|nr:putative xap5 domain containing protein [Botrytis fragariae]KAF5872460.1 putative xap5 domain containing protein [Botrytis fragariae]
MSSNPPSEPPSRTTTPNPQSRFTSQSKTVEDVLSTQTVGLVKLSDFRKRRAEAVEMKERDAHEIGSGRSGASTPVGDGASTPTDSQSGPLKKKKKKAGTPKLSFGVDDEEGGENTDSEPSRSATPDIPNKKKKIGVNSSVSFVPKTLTKSALLKEAQTRESLRKEFLAIQEAVKGTEIAIPFVFYDGTNIPGGVARVKKGDFIWVFLDRSRKVGAELGVGEKANSNREWARVGVDDLMLVRGGLIIPHHYDFYYFIINHTLGPNSQVLFPHSSSPPPTASITPLDTDPPIPESYNPLSRPSASSGTKTPTTKVEDLEGFGDDPTFTKVVDRRWYERNKHIYPASVWQEFKPEKDYQTEVKRDAGGNAFFFS